jgi:hypothetical protein
MLAKGWSAASLLSILTLVASACGDGRDFGREGAGATGGKAGSSPQAGKGGSGTSAGSSGRGGSGDPASGGAGTGNPGTGGIAGADGGTAGADGGTAGIAGNPEIDGGDSGVGGSTSGRGGNGNAGGPQDGGAGGAPPDPREPCEAEDEGEIRCAGNAERGRLRCDGEFWQEYDECDATERCDTRAESEAACAPVVNGCADKAPGDGACAGLEHFECGPDLVTAENAGSCESFCVELEDGTAECSACEDGQFSPDGTPEGCTDWSTCAEGQYVSSAATATTDRQCTDCDEGSYSATANALSCTEWKTCEAGTSVTEDGTPTSDRECTSCASGTYSATTNATSCSTWATCPTGTFVSEDGTPSQNRECSACASGSYSTTQNAASCTTWSNCAAGTFVATTGSTTTNRTCSACASGTYSSTQNAASCSTWATCAMGTFVSEDGTPSQNRECSACASGSYSTTQNATSCSSWSNCATGTFVATAGSTTTNRTCSACASGTYSSTQNAASCSTWATCAAGTFASTAGTASQNRVCSSCASGSYSTTQNATSCTSWTNCAAGTFVSTAGTTTTNRACSACSAGTFSASQNASSCGPWTTCTWQMGGTATAGTPSSNTVCNAANPYRQLGTVNADFGSSVAVDGAGNVFLIGDVGADFISPNPTGDAAFIRKYDVNGDVVWTRQFSATSAGTIAFGVTADSAGNSYVTGYTGGVLDGSSAGAVDAFVRKYDSAGNVSWTRQFGTDTSDYGRSVSVDSSGNVYVAGQTGGTFSGATSAGNNDAYVRKYNSSGTAQWTRQWGTSGSDTANAVIANGSGSVYVASTVAGDGELRTLNPSTGADAWAAPGTISTTGGEEARGLAVSGNGESFVAGYTGGDLAGVSAGGGADVYVRKYNATGGVVWTRQFGTTASEYGAALVVDGSGNVYVAGYTNGAITGTNAGGSDAFVRKYGPTGSVLWTQQFGGSANDETDGLAADGSENLYIAGSTFGALGATGFGSWDAFVRQVVP